ncbi:MAG: metallophosphoesterase [Bacteroidales bacterium]|jgi:hypothetical protein|nr:metallophosphoesterase [Bacteroidales bacterium]
MAEKVKELKKVNSIYFDDIKTLAFCGDIHGEFGSTTFKLDNYTDTVLIVCGDIGMGFHSDEYYFSLFKRINLKLSKNRNYLVMFRGNHDNPDFFNGSFKKYSNIYLVPDYTVVEVSGIANVLCVGGATSIDRSYRIKQELQNRRKIYWGDAELPYFDRQALHEINSLYVDNIQIVATHTCPSFAYPTTKQNVQEWINIDESLSQTLDNERNTMDKIFEMLRTTQKHLTDWYYGHFHEHRLEQHYGINFRLCDCNEVNIFRNYK